MIAWMLYTVLVSACLLVAASAAEWLLRLRRLPVRIAWIIAAMSCVVFAGVARFRPAPTTRTVSQTVDLSTLALVQSGMQTVQRSVPASADLLIAGAAIIAAFVVALSFALAYLRLHRARRRWPTVDLHGKQVRLSADVGPVVIGVARAEIVVPRWVVGRSTDEQRLIVEHEASHVSARDPLLLCAGCALAAIMPWNPALWMILSRLRLAIELDCDARVLRRGSSPRAYGTLLVDVAEHARPLRFASLALSDAASHLQRRIVAMESRRISHPIVRGACVALVGLAGLLAACEAKVPTSADIARMDASSAEQSVKAIGLARNDSSEVWMVDGRRVSALAAKAIVPDSIATVSVTGVDGKTPVTMSIRTNRRGAGADEHSELPAIVMRPSHDEGSPLELRPVPDKDQPVLIIDGKRAAFSALKSLDRAKIEAVEVVKGPNAIQAYGADAKNGVIVIRTKS